MTTAIAVVNHKGGVGKTTCSAYIGYILSSLGKKVLLIDCDPQGNLTRDIGIEPKEYEGEKTLANAIRNKLDRRAAGKASADFVQTTDYPNIDILIGNQDLKAIRTDITEALMRGVRVYKRIISDLLQNNDYDIVILDLLPGLGPENTQVLLAADYILIPTSADRNSVEGMDDLLAFYEDCKDSNENLDILGILVNNVDAKDSVSIQVINLLKATYGDYLFNTIVEHSKVAEKIPWTGIKPSKNKSYIAFEAVTKEILKRIG